jgi:coiled-coil domain-containing protein 55
MSLVKSEKNKSMDAFSRNRLNDKFLEHKAVLEAMKKIDVEPEKAEQNELKDEDERLVEAARREGKQVVLNENNEVVNKRDLLGAGLNAKSKFGSFASLADSDEKVRERVLEYEEYKRKKLAESEAKRRENRGDQRELISRQVEQQRLEAEAKAREEEEKKQEEQQQRATAKRTTDEVAMSAKERYLARKMQKQEEKNKAS